MQGYFAIRRREPSRQQRLNLRIGDVVEVRSESEILATLDDNGELDALQFMPEMLQFCGQQFKVHKLAIKACDTINSTGQHRMHDAVHLAGVRCDGQAHCGCQACCLIYWKEAWLKRVEPDGREGGHSVDSAASARQGRTTDAAPSCTRARLFEATRRGGGTTPDGETFSCQATGLMRAAPELLRWWDVRLYIRDVRSGNAPVLSMIRSVAIMLFNFFQGFCRRYLPAFLWFNGGKKFPNIEGKLHKTPQAPSGLMAGDRVRVRLKEEIFQTLDTRNRNRGLLFDREMLKYCGRQLRVRGRVEKIIDEKTGRMLFLKNPCIILDDVTCSGEYNHYCPRGIYHYWREIWLERVE